MTSEFINTSISVFYSLLNSQNIQIDMDFSSISDVKDARVYIHQIWTAMVSYPYCPNLVYCIPIIFTGSDLTSAMEFFMHISIQKGHRHPHTSAGVASLAPVS